MPFCPVRAAPYRCNCVGDVPRRRPKNETLRFRPQGKVDTIDLAVHRQEARLVYAYAGRLLSLETAVLVKVASCAEKNRPPGSGCPRFCGREPVAVSAFASLVAPSALSLSASRCARSFRSDETCPWRQPAGAIPEGKVFKFRAGWATPSAVLFGRLATHVGRPLNCRREVVVH